ncbi:MAG: type II toxin-antitoxin system MqsA family antitoxin [bacterium]|nr:type II toxin-antitoxin system MqsA family antitoxin [bacterium]
MRTPGEQILEGLEDALDYAQGKQEGQRAHRVAVLQDIDVRAVRQQLHMSQQEFAENFGFSIHSIRNWEQGKRHPQGPARILLTVIARNPQAVQHALGGLG